jgi:hypothetical protein
MGATGFLVVGALIEGRLMDLGGGPVRPDLVTPFSTVFAGPLRAALLKCLHVQG